MPTINFGIEFYFSSFPGLLAAEKKSSSSKERGKQFQGTWSRVPHVTAPLPSSAHKSLRPLTDFHPRKTALLCLDTALEGIITELLPCLKNTYFRRAICGASTRSPSLPGSWWHQQHGLAWGSGLETQAASATVTLSNQAV